MKTKLFRLAVILLVTALFIIGGCAVDEKGSASEGDYEGIQEPTTRELPSEETPVAEDDFDISTVDIESDLDLSDLEDIDAQLEDINW